MKQLGLYARCEGDAMSDADPQSDIMYEKYLEPETLLACGVCGACDVCRTVLVLYWGMSAWTSRMHHTGQLEEWHRYLDLTMDVVGKHWGDAKEEYEQAWGGEDKCWRD